MSNLRKNIQFKRQLHIRFFKRFLNFLPTFCERHESLRLTIVFFIVSGLDVLDALDEINDERKKDIINWVYNLQVEPSQNDGDLSRCGFQCSPFLNLPENDADSLSPLLKQYRCANLAMNYSGLLILLILGDDLSRVNKEALLEGVKALQHENGCFASVKDIEEMDMRFVYCAVAVSYILNDWSAINRKKTVEFIYQSMGYDHGFGQGPFLESHGGSTYCAVASLVLMEELHNTLSSKQLSMLTRWCIFRQESGFHGRPNKPDDTCYSFWIGATLKMLGASDLINTQENRSFVLSTQKHLLGGFSKWIDVDADPLHTYLGLGGLSIIKEEGLLELHPALNITQRAFKHLQQLHRKEDTSN